MELSNAAMSAGDVLAEVVALLDRLDPREPALLTDKEQLAQVRVAVRVAGRCEALLQRLLAEAERTQAATTAHGTSLTTWLATVENLTPREAAAMSHAGKDAAAFPAIEASMLTGDVLPQQGRAITRVLAGLPEELAPETVRVAEAQLCAFAATHNSTELGRLSRHLLEIVAPEICEESEARRLEREFRQAERDRHLSFVSTGHGSVLIRGSLPTASADALRRIVDAYAAQAKRGLEAIDRLSVMPSRDQRRADGLMAMVHRHQQESLAPSHGGDRPRVVVTIDYDRLLARCVEAELVASGERVPAAVLRQLACDADILPAVLGGASEPLDVGRLQCLATPPIRAALEVRDRGCIFPGCDKPPQDCEAHHRIPWWAGGETSLENLLLVCPHHHGIVEPGHDPNAQRWRVEFGDDGLPRVIPPAYVDPTGRPRLHARFRTRPGVRDDGGGDEFDAA